jgi:hypothetical protein
MQQHTAIGIRTHSGWAAIVTVAGRPPEIEILDRRRVEICDPGVKGAKQPYHFVEELNLAAAEKHLNECAAASERMAAAALRGILEKYRITGVSLLLAAGRELPALPRILASHALIHTAEGEFFRDAFRRACAELNVTLHGIRERELGVLAPTTWQRRISEIGKEIGPPWTADQKLAALGACLALDSRVQKVTTRQIRVR